MATTTIRWAATKVLLDRARNHPVAQGVQVEAGFPGDALAAEAIWIDELDGQLDMPVMSAGRKKRDDTFTIPFQIRVTGRLTLDDTMTRLSELVAVLEDVVADDPTLGDLDGVMSAEVVSERETSADLKGGRIGFAEVVIEIHARLH